jgi:glucosylceramidase
MSPITRRDFLSLTTGAALLACSKPSLLWSAPFRMQAWTTTADKRFAAITPPLWRSAGAVSPQGIRLNADEPHQQILGFGAAFTDASCYWFDRLSPQQRQSLLAELFGPQGLRLSVCRTCIGSSDYSASLYSFDDGTDPDPELKRFSIEHDRAYILPTLRAALEVNPDLFLFSSPWSPPGWMKAGGSMLGGSMRKHYYAPYAQYLLKFLQAYAADGVKIRALTVQNEADTDQDGRMPATLWGQEYEIEFVKNHLGPALEHAGLDTKIWVLDHNYNLWGRAIDELSDPDLNKYVDGIAWHGYAGTPDAMSRVRQAFPAKHCYWTEGGPDYTTPDYLTDWVKWSHTFADILRNSAECIVGWNLLLDEKGTPNLGPFSCGGLLTVDSKTHELTRSGQYWAFAHYSKVVQRGARVVASSGTLKGIAHVAFDNPDGSHAVVLTNDGEAQQIHCYAGSQVLDPVLDANSVTTLLWA